ncbi:uncharacterized protein B0H18DRAFT_53016 [Fomitopsis serialis]|uniref:uncharacterized protein n=1 Tax=Fomitopsis serialis TaxID=139415 RepID=UPI002007345A|nr:uncharacterized protein B0H18DRAFT_53016 [Neoantrodia serialis]KAH9932303.1 hypothetical protein B0H18DRAFT_53016 [Neoantrodia serialis]
MEDDAEVLDWGHEDDEQTAQHGPEDAEDAVSLGGDEDDMQDYYSYQAAEQEVAAQLPNSYSTSHGKRESYGSKQSAAPPRDPDSPHLRRSQSVGKLTHALPPKPVLSVAPVHPSPAQASTLASSMIQREPRTNGLGMPVSGSNHDALPPDWELRQARSGGGEQYYYNTKTHESTWTQPVSGKSSPAKDKERGVSRGREGVSPSRRVISPERRTGRKESKRAADDLSYEDRHYRPAAAPGGAGGTELSDRRDGRTAHSPVQAAYADSYTAGRAPSPRPLPERRRTRSLSPPARRDYRSEERSGRSRREQTPPRAQERDLADVRRGNHSSRISMDLDPPPRHSRARGRQDRMDFDVSPRNASLDREQTNRRGPNDWSAPRTRSPPPHLRVPSPPGARRFSRGSSPGSSQASIPPPPASRQRAWPERPPILPRPSSPRGFNDYPPVDSVPQRRGREADSMDPSYGYDTKRRRVDDQRDDDLPPRRGSAIDALPPHGLPARPQTGFSSPVQDERPRKRVPLPPQSARFREARHAPVQELLPPPTPAAEGSRRGYVDIPPRGPREDDVPMRYVDVPTDAPPPRRQGPLTIGEVEYDGRGRPPPIRPALTSRPGSRFDDLPSQGPRDYAPEPMDVDRPASLPSQRGFDGPSRPSSSMYADRMGDVPGDAPRGPRAMAGGREPMGHVPSQRFPPLETQGLPPPPPSHASSWNIGSPSTPRGGHRTVSRPILEVNPTKEPSFGPPPPKSISGTNLVPIGNRKIPPMHEPDGTLPLQDRLPPANTLAAPRIGPGRGRDYPLSPDPPFGSPERSAVPLDDSRLGIRRPSVSSAGRVDSGVERLPARPVEDRPPLLSRPRGDSYSERKDRGPRVSRFGPEHAQPSAPIPPDTQPRIWMTREESAQLEMHSKDTKKVELMHKLPERPARTEPDSWRTTDGANPPTRSNGNHNARGDKEPVRESTRSATGPGSVGPGRQSDFGLSDPPGGRKSPVDVRPRGRRPSLEDRLGPLYNDRHASLAPPPASLPPRPVNRDVYIEPTRHSDYRDVRNEAPVREDDASAWDRPGVEPSRDVSPANSATRIHPDRVRLLHTAPAPQPLEEPVKTSKPVRIRRPPPMTKASPEESPVADRLLPDEVAGRSSLLDRLSLNDAAPIAPETSTASLRERVDLSSKQPGLQGGDSHGDFVMDTDMEGGDASRSKGGRRRGSRPKRGRRSGYPA